MRVMDGLMAFPAILLAIALMAARGPGVWNVIFALSLVYMPRTAHARPEHRAERSASSTTSRPRARSAGADVAIALPPHPAELRGAAPRPGHASSSPTPILAEAILGFLGVGVPPYVPSWGNVIASGKNVIREAFWVSLFPGVALTVAGLSLNLLGDGLRDVLDPRLRVR